MDGARHISGNRQAPNVWWNGSERKADVNWIENYGNAYDWFVFRRNSLYSPWRYVGEFYFFRRRLT